jgi:aryl-alcohol dehydrogenase-like predicted oxidoreductase
MAAEVGASLAQYALAWTLTNPVVTAPIIGPRTMEQLEDSLETLQVTLPAEHLTRIDQMVPPGTDVEDEHPPFYFGRAARNAPERT